MLTYLGKIIDNATDFFVAKCKGGTQSAAVRHRKAAVTRSDTNGIECIMLNESCSCTTNHPDISKQNWGRTQVYAKSHGSAKNLHKNICAHCLSQGKILPHMERLLLLQKLAVNC